MNLKKKIIAILTIFICFITSNVFASGMLPTVESLKKDIVNTKTDEENTLIVLENKTILKKAEVYDYDNPDLSKNNSNIM